MLISTPVQLAHIPVQTKTKAIEGKIEVVSPEAQDIDVSADMVVNLYRQTTGYIRSSPIAKAAYAMIDTIMHILTVGLSTDTMVRIIFYFILFQPFIRSMGFTPLI
jgi:hypothetical protein